MEFLPATHRLYTTYFPLDGRDIFHANEGARIEYLEGKVRDLMQHFHLELEGAVEHVISGTEPMGSSVTPSGSTALWN